MLATTNEKKRKELERLVVGLGYRILTPSDFPGYPAIEETGETFEENATLKATAACRFTGQIALADDSGLEVDALGEQPGVRSARFAGEGATDAQNNAKLLEMLRWVPPEARAGRYRCAIAIATPPCEEESLHQRLWIGHGMCEGWIATSPRGDRGFGYDPLFVVPEYGQTFGELPPGLKDAISHRSRALQWAVEVLRSLVGGSDTT